MVWRDSTVSNEAKFTCGQSSFKIGNPWSTEPTRNDL